VRVVFDGTPFLLEKTGVGHYTYHLILGLKEVEPSLEVAVMAISLRGGHRLSGVELPEGVEARGFNLPANLLYYILWPRTNFLSAERLVGRMDVFHATNYQAPALREAALVSTVHDVNFVRFPEMQSRGMRRFIEGLPRLLRRSSVVLADSHFTRQEILELYDLPEEKVEVVYPGLNPLFLRKPREEDVHRALQAYGIEPPYLAYIGNLHPRKNLVTLLEAYALFRERGYPQRLAVIGGGGLGRMNQVEFRKICRRVEELGLEEWVRFTGYVPDETLVCLLSRADMLVFPSLYEGFGLPPVEAMACGVPVVTSRRASLPEVVGDAALLVEDPLDPVEIADKMALLFENEELRRLLVERGRKNAGRFHWRTTAEQVLSIYRRVAS
jgi:glycosyltransferase involved in cell wall biosynthesis